MRSKTKGFTILEALAAAALMAVGIVACMGALGGVAKEESLAKQKDFVEHLAQQKYDEVITTNTTTLASQSGDFSDRNLPGYTWSLDLENSQVSNLETVTVTVQKQNAGPKDPKATIEGLLYISPNSTSTGASTAP